MHVRLIREVNNKRYYELEQELQTGLDKFSVVCISDSLVHPERLAFPAKEYYGSYVPVSLIPIAGTIIGIHEYGKFRKVKSDEKYLEEIITSHKHNFDGIEAQ